MKKASKIGIIVLLSFLFASIGAVAYAQIQVSVYIKNPLGSDAKGAISGSCWVGEIPITVSNSTVAAQQTKAYCMNFDKTVYAGSTYSSHATAVMDSAEWRAVSYILTWYHPPADNDAAAANQVAIWRILNSTRGYDYYKEPWLTTALDNAGNALSDEVMNKDVVRQGDVFQWIEPVTTNQSAVMGNPGEAITFKAKLTDAFGAPRAGVKILFSAVLRPDNTALDTSLINPAVTHTDSNGIAEVTITVPDDIKNGESIEVKASTKSVWPQLYLDLDEEGRQDLIGIGTTFELTVSTNVCVLAYILVIPEVPLGTLTAGAACGFAFVFWKKGGHLEKAKTELNGSRSLFPIFIACTNFSSLYSELLLGIPRAHSSVRCPRLKSVLFLCTHNSARSQMAEAFLNKLCGDRYKAKSAGVTPTQINPYVAKVMAEIGIDLSTHRSKSIMEFQGKTFDYVVTVCDSARETCPFFPGEKEIHKSFPDPSAVKGTEEEILRKVRIIRDEIKSWVETAFCGRTIPEGDLVELFRK